MYKFYKHTHWMMLTIRHNVVIPSFFSKKNYKYILNDDKKKARIILLYPLGYNTRVWTFAVVKN